MFGLHFVNVSLTQTHFVNLSLFKNEFIVIWLMFEYFFSQRQNETFLDNTNVTDKDGAK